MCLFLIPCDSPTHGSFGLRSCSLGCGPFSCALLLSCVSALYCGSFVWIPPLASLFLFPVGPLCVSFSSMGFSGVFLWPLSSSSFLVFSEVFFPPSCVCWVHGCCSVGGVHKGSLSSFVRFYLWCLSVLPLSSLRAIQFLQGWGWLALVFVVVSLVIAPFDRLHFSTFHSICYVSFFWFPFSWGVSDFGGSFASHRWSSSFIIDVAPGVLLHRLPPL